MRRSIVARHNLTAGQTISDQDLTCKRPASGIAPREWDKLVGRQTSREIPAGTILHWDDICD